MISDYHLHTEFSGDSQTPAKDQIECAIKQGMQFICITDHHDYDVKSDVDFTLDFDRYFSTLKTLQEDYADRISIRIGVEMGLQAHLTSYIDELLSLYPFDFVIGSTHFIHGQDPYYPRYFQGRTEESAYGEYFETLLENVRELDGYDVIGHIDYIVRYGPNKNKFYSYLMYQDILDNILMTIIEKGKGIECNCAGYRQNLGHPNPHPDVLRRYRELGGEVITVGSDAHFSKDLGRDFEAARRLLLECGFTYYSTFKNRKPEFHKL